MFRAVAIIGVGLLGGSLGLAIKQRGLAKKVLGLALPDYPRGLVDLAAARKRGAIDDICEGIENGLQSVDFLIACTPVDRIADHVSAALEFLPEHALATDVGSTKANIVDRLSQLRPDVTRFVGSHPMAGSDRSGPEAASAQLFAGRNCIITPTEKSDQRVVDRISEFWRQLGMNVLFRSPDEHDRIVSRTSHLPHVAAAALTSLISSEDRPFVGAGLLDTTRIAGGSPEIWTAILRHNRSAVLAALAELRASLDRVGEALDKEDAQFLYQWLEDAKRDREALGR